MRNKFEINTANYGISGGGPLLSLAALSEYGNRFKPNYVIYLYSEENDMQDLKNEETTFLINYLGNFSQNLIEKNDEIIHYLDEIRAISLDFHKKN